MTGLEDSDECPGETMGRDPRRMTQDELRALGHQAMSPLAALRLRCIDCCAGSPTEVRRCVSTSCPAWPFRMGKSPWRSPVSEARREAGRRLARAAKIHRQEKAGGEAEASPAGGHRPDASAAET
ncbi:MAG: hypothetical protein KIT18_15750 [Burkholderiales bacterium]|nr:hypothetical protein [Burkholderiales bacterium]